MLAERRLASQVLALLVTVLGWLAPGPARADESDFYVDHDVLVTPRALTIAWCDGGGIWVGEWDLSTRTWMSKTEIRVDDGCSSIRLARSADSIILVTGDGSGGNPDSRPVQVLRLERSMTGFVEKSATKLAGGFAPSLVASDDAIVVASFEDLPEIPSAAQKPPPPPRKMHLRVLDPRTLAVVAARTVYGRGEQGLRPHLVPEISGRAMAIVGGVLHVGVPDEKARLSTFTLPALHPLRDRLAQIDTRVNDGFTTSMILGRNAAGLTMRAQPLEPTAAVKAALATLR